MAEEYKRQIQYAPQIRVIDQSGGRAIVRALDTAQKVTQEANQQLAKSVAGVGTQIDKLRAKSAIDDFSVEFEEIEIENENGTIEKIQRPKPINRPLFFTQDAAKMFDQFALSKAKAQIGLELDKEATNIANKIKYDIGGTSDDFNGLMTPIVEAYAEQLPNSYKPILDITMQEIQAQHSNSIDAYHQKLQVDKNNVDTEDILGTYQGNVERALSANQQDKATKLIEELKLQQKTLEVTSPYGAKYTQRTIDSLEAMQSFYKQYGNLINPMDLQGQTIKGQKAYLHNMIAMQSLLRGEPVKFYSDSSLSEPDVEVTLDQFNEQLGNLTPDTITRFQKHITGRISALNAIIETDESDLMMSNLSKLTPDQITKSTLYSDVGQDMFKGSPSNLSKGMMTMETVMRNVDPNFTLNGQYDFDPSNPIHLQMFQKVGFLPTVFQKRIDTELFQNKNLKVLEMLMNRNVAFGVETNIFRQLEVSEKTRKLLEKVDAVRDTGMPLDISIFDIPSLNERLEKVAAQEGISKTQLRADAEEATKNAIYDMEGIKNRFGLGLAEASFGRDIIDNDNIDDDIYRRVLTATFVTARNKPNSDLSDLKDIAESHLLRLAAQGRIGASKYTRPRFGDVSVDGTKALVPNPIENHIMVDPNTGEDTTKHIDAFIYRAYLDTIPTGEKPRKWKDIKDKLFIIPLSQQGNFTDPVNPLLERYTLHMMDDTGIAGGQTLTSFSQGGQIILNPYIAFQGMRKHELDSQDEMNKIMATSSRNGLEYAELPAQEKIAVANRIGFGSALDEQLKNYNEYVSILNE